MIGIGDMPQAATYGLTTFANPFHDIGDSAVKSIIALLQGGEVETNCKRLPMTLIERDSVAAPKVFD